MVNSIGILTKRTALGFFWLALTGFLATTAEAQLYIEIYPSQDNPNSETIWLFGGRETRPFYGSSIRSSGNYHRRDSWKIESHKTPYTTNKPTNALFNLSPLFGSTNTKDIASITTRLAGGARVTSPFYTGISFPTNFTNTPTMAVFTNSVLSASKTIGSIFMNDDAVDEIGIRGASGGGNLRYGTNNTFLWFGSGILNKPIGDFTFSIGRDFPSIRNAQTHTPFFTGSNGRVIFWINHHVIPEPAEYALVFGLFALAFVIVRRRFQKKEFRNGR